MNRHARFIPTENKHQDIMDDLNDLLIAIKMHLYDMPMKDKFLKPTYPEIDSIQTRINTVLIAFDKPLIKK